MLIAISRHGNKMHIYSLNQYELKYCIYHGSDLFSFKNVIFDRIKSKYLCMICEQTGNLYLINLKKCDEYTVCQCDEYEELPESEAEESTFSSFFKIVKVVLNKVRTKFLEMVLLNLYIMVCLKLEIIFISYILTNLMK
jgi:hypothetical protein